VTGPVRTKGEAAKRRRQVAAVLREALVLREAPVLRGARQAKKGQEESPRERPAVRARAVGASSSPHNRNVSWMTHSVNGARTAPIARDRGPSFVRPVKCAWTGSDVNPWARAELEAKAEPAARAESE